MQNEVHETSSVAIHGTRMRFEQYPTVRHTGRIGVSEETFTGPK